MMFKPKNNAGHSMLATKLEYWPYNKLTEAARSHVMFRHAHIITKAELLDLLDPTLTHLISRSGPIVVKYKVVWAYGNAPTVTEWERISKHSRVIVELRTVPMLGNYNGKSANICILSLPASTVL